MAPQWSAEEDRALLLALVQVMAPNGPSKHQFEAALKIANDRWTIGAATQHYNKKLRPLTPGDIGEGEEKPATPARSATKRKAPTPRATKAAKSPTPASSGGRRKKATPKPLFPNLRTTSEEAEEEDEEEQVATKKAKIENEDDDVEGEEE